MTGTIRKSPELIAIARRWGNAIDARDSEALRNLLSDSDCLRYIGTGDGESWTGQILRDGIGDHFLEVPEHQVGKVEIEAFECGPAGWACLLVPIRFDVTETYVVHRISYVFVLEQGLWKIVQIHMSNPMSNVEKMGVEQTALDALVAAAKDSFDHFEQVDAASIMFTDIVDSSAMADRLGDRTWAAMIRSHMDLLSDIIAANNGTMVKSLGDGTMSVFSEPKNALSAARTIQSRLPSEPGKPALQIRVGIHSGSVVQDRDDFFGTVVNKAARLTSVARPGEIRVSDDSRILVAGGQEFEFDDPAIVPLRGLDGEHLIYRLRKE